MKKKNQTKETDCLESILDIFFNDGKKQKLFLSKVKRAKEGYVEECFTKKGGEVYEQFVGCCGVLGVYFGTIANLKNFVKSLENIGMGDDCTWNDVVETTDMIASED